MAMHVGKDVGVVSRTMSLIEVTAVKPSLQLSVTFESTWATVSFG